MHRIVSLLPSATEIVCALGLQDQLVGVSHECDYPATVRGLPRVTRTLIPHDASSARIDDLVRERLQSSRALYTLDEAVLASLHPTLIVTQALCDVCAVAADEVCAVADRLPGAPRVINLEPSRLSDVFDAMRQIGEAAEVGPAADVAIAALEERVRAVATRTARRPQFPRVVLLEWIDPPFSSGHWSPELVRLAGGVEVVGRESARSRTIGWDDVRGADPEVLVIACCGFDLERTRKDLPLLSRQPGFANLAAVRSGRVYMVDGNAYFSRPGPRLVDSLELLAHALHPDLHPLPAALPAAVRLGPADW